ncbi:MAG: hypothetical protein NTX64_17050, partial [Elusimicrobia bacterium]|nr:hypothetical protein [Elusimicrobiota bacterium]
QLLGSVEDAQYSVFRRLTGGANSHTFFRKSYWLNTGDPVTDAKEGAGYFHTIHPKAECIRYINICGNKPTNDPYQPYKPVEPEHPIEMPNTVSNELCDGGLFHFAWVPQSEAQDVQVHGSGSGGYGIIQHWTAPNNYFKINFNNMSTCGTPGENKPCIHATIGLTGKGSVWPDPTPKFQTRMYP